MLSYPRAKENFISGLTYIVTVNDSFYLLPIGRDAGDISLMAYSVFQCDLS